MTWDGAEGAFTPAALSLWLDSMVKWNRLLIETHRIPELYSSGLRYQREDYDSVHPEDWRDAIAMLKHGGGDCEDLATLRVAQLQKAGEPARVVFVERPHAKGRLFHILVERGDGTLEDPSRMLGMTRL
jgi:hypothetical protein